MADLSDVMNALAAVVAQQIYPNGTSLPSAIMVNGRPVPARIYPGWPVPSLLDADLAAGKINVSIYAPPGMERNTTRYPRKWVVTESPAKTVTAIVGGNGTTVTIGGTVSTPQNVGIICNGNGYPYRVLAGDTLDTIATALAALVNADTTATATGSVITIPAATALIARVGGVSTASKEVRRQNRLFQITFWCPAIPGASPSAARGAAVNLVDPILADMDFITLADGSAGRLLYVRTTMSDGDEKAGCYRRDLFYSVEYATTQTAEAPEIIMVEARIQGAAIPFEDFTDTNPPTQVVTF